MCTYIHCPAPKISRNQPLEATPMSGKPVVMINWQQTVWHALCMLIQTDSGFPTISQEQEKFLGMRRLVVRGWVGGRDMPIRGSATYFGLKQFKLRHGNPWRLQTLFVSSVATHPIAFSLIQKGGEGVNVSGTLSYRWGEESQKSS